MGLGSWPQGPGGKTNGEDSPWVGGFLPDTADHEGMWLMLFREGHQSACHVAAGSLGQLWVAAPAGLAHLSGSFLQSPVSVFLCLFFCISPVMMNLCPLNGNLVLPKFARSQGSQFLSSNNTVTELNDSWG